jgi:hypothetical protein
MTIYFCEGNYFILIILFQHTHQIPLHILVDFAVAGEGTAAFFVAAEGADQVRVFDLFVEVADKAARARWEDATSLRGRISCSLVVGL